MLNGTDPFGPNPFGSPSASTAGSKKDLNAALNDHHASNASNASIASNVDSMSSLNQFPPKAHAAEPASLAERSHVGACGLGAAASAPDFARGFSILANGASTIGRQVRACFFLAEVRAEK
eukprot:2934978-Pleurochrysis_carterae.AAC.3